ncbi:uncharacterized protein M6B38_409035 [Iris pallida]|uniref:Protein WVD2-like 7 n=1 Tax=Iris pallida TaxID=29817 RepID=A0AAX6FP97_IRIPA|nr:uncharacterized protein M6B38_409035 [Iris pallida]
MATYVDQAYYEWPNKGVTHLDEPEEVSASQILDHGSISFGRFACESLSWERRSVFTHNKCQEELEKFKCPGLVAKKKAYFEEYYKRIRAMKDSQENQQTELTLDYGGDESISSQNGEEDEIAARLGNFGEEAANIVGGHPEEASVEISTGNEKEKGILEVQNKHYDPVTATIDHGSLRSDYEDLEQEDYNKYPLELEEASLEISMVKEILEVQSRHSDVKTTAINLDSLRRSSEVLEQEDNTMYPLQMQQSDTENQDYKSLTRITEVTKQHDLGNLGSEAFLRDNSITHIEPDRTFKEKKLHPSSSKLRDLELKSAKKMVSEKVMPRVRNHKDHVSIVRVKEPSAAGRHGSKLENKTKPDIVKPSQGPKYASERTPKKSGNFTASSKTSSDKLSRKASSDKLSRNCKSFSTPSHWPLNEVQSCVTFPRPLSSAADKRAAVLSGKREGPTKSDDKASHERIPLAVHKKDVNVQASSKRRIFTPGAQSRGLENKRGHAERNKPLPLDRLRISLKERAANVPELPKARSVNLPPRNNCNSSSGSDNRIKGDPRASRQKEERSEARLREICLTGRKVATPPARNLGCETKKVVSSLIAGKKLPFGDQSLDGKKPRQEKPRWR